MGGRGGGARNGERGRTFEGGKEGNREVSVGEGRLERARRPRLGELCVEFLRVPGGGWGTVGSV